MSGSGWIGVDLDGTLAFYDTWRGHTHIGHAIPQMLERVKDWIEEGQEVRIFTARVSCADPERTEIINAVQDWLEALGLPRLQVTCIKDFAMLELYDDRAVQVRMNTGQLVGYSTRN